MITMDITSVKMALIYEINQWAIASHSTHYDFGYVKSRPKDGAYQVNTITYIRISYRKHVGNLVVKPQLGTYKRCPF